jgi:hypothetical protein
VFAVSAGLAFISAAASLTRGSDAPRGRRGAGKRAAAAEDELVGALSAD